jgi:Cytochrome c7 and related cytochrome c
VRLPEQITRIGFVLAVLVGAVILVRFVVLPPDVFSTKLHQSSTVRRIEALPVRYAGSATCAECHEDEYVTKNKGYHRGLACETCHGAATGHAEAPDEVTPPAPRDRKFCPVCHAYDPARPTGFPQINPTMHNPRKACITCHQPHDPVPPEVPKECSACHGQISRTKAVSSHALLACTTCHVVPQQHRITPRRALPTKPDTREFCGQCHAKGATNPDSPKIDMTAHGGNYLCWQCHYPHLPEGRP